MLKNIANGSDDLKKEGSEGKPSIAVTTIPFW
jgi:hypothetical protein